MNLEGRLRSALAERYRIVRQIGAGGMALVFLAEDLKHSRPVALKVLRPELAAAVGAERFLREIAIIAKLQHPLVLPLHDSGEADGLPFFVMPYIEGESLAEYLKQGGGAELGDALRILRDIAEALSAAHDQGVLHRDVKPANVLVSGGHAVVTDFGIAKAFQEASPDTALTEAGSYMGTATYVSPEQLSGDPIDHRADIYSFGILAYELLCGEPPFRRKGAKALFLAHLVDAPPPLRTHRENLPSRLEELVMRCIEKAPAARWGSFEEILEEIERVVADTVAETRPTGRRMVPLIVSGTLAAVALTYGAMDVLGLPDWVMPAVLVLASLGGPVLLLTGRAESRRSVAERSANESNLVDRFSGWLSWRRSGLLALGTFVAFAVIVASFTVMRTLGIGPAGTLLAAGVLAERDELIVADFANRTSDATLGPSLTEALRVGLAQSPRVRVKDAASVRRTLQRMGRGPGVELTTEVAIEVAVREGTKAIVAAEIGPIGSGYILSGRLILASDGSELVAVGETADDAAGLIRAVDELSAKLRERIGDSFRSIRANTPLAQVTTGSLEALRLYTQGLRAEGVDGNVEGAIALLERAVAVDTAFAMAYRMLAAWHANIGTSPGQAIESARQARRYRDRLPEVERYNVEALYNQVVEYRPNLVISNLRSVLELRPNDAGALNTLSFILNQSRRFEEAEGYAVRAIEVGGLWSNYANAVWAQVGTGRLADAEDTVEEYSAGAPDSPIALWLRADYESAARRYRDAKRTFQTLAETQPGSALWFSVAQAGAAGAAEALGQISASAASHRSLMTAIDQPETSGPYVDEVVQLAWLDLLYRDARDSATARIDAALARYPLGDMPITERPYLSLAYFFANAGRISQAQRLLGEYRSSGARASPSGPRLNAFRPVVLREEAVEGSIAMAEGRVRDAVDAFRAWREGHFCTVCGFAELGGAFEALGQPDSARVAYERATENRTLFGAFEEYRTLARASRRLGEMYEERGSPGEAVPHYERFVELWADADPILQPQVAAVRARLEALRN